MGQSVNRQSPTFLRATSNEQRPTTNDQRPMPNTIAIITAKYQKAECMTISAIKQVLQAQPELELAVLVGSQADAHAHADSDWDVAIQWNRRMSAMDNLANTETLRRKLASAARVTEDLIDLIDTSRAGCIHIRQ